MSDVKALNREFERYDQVRKAHTYRLAESDSDEFDEDYRIATLDFEPFLKGGAGDQARFAEDFANALSEIGFAVLTGHGVDVALYDEMHEAVTELFETTTVEERMRFRATRYGSVNQGYFPIEETSDIHPDLVEGWVWCRRAFDIPQKRRAPFRAERPDDETRARSESPPRSSTYDRERPAPGQPRISCRAFSWGRLLLVVQASSSNSPTLLPIEMADRRFQIADSRCVNLRSEIRNITCRSRRAPSSAPCRRWS